MQSGQRYELVLVRRGLDDGDSAVRARYSLGLGARDTQPERSGPVEQPDRVPNDVHALVLDRLTADVRGSVRIVVTLGDVLVESDAVPVVVVVVNCHSFAVVLVLGPVPFTEQDERQLMVVGMIRQQFW